MLNYLDFAHCMCQVMHIETMYKLWGARVDAGSYATNNETTICFEICCVHAV